jgi:hypothetical protein
MQERPSKQSATFTHLASITQSANLSPDTFQSPSAIHWTYLFIVQYTYLDVVPPADAAGSSMTWDIFILNWLLDRY